MRVPLSWLCELTPLGTRPTDREQVATLASQLDSLGLVVESVERVGEGLDEVVLARVLEIAAIPKADRIRRVVVDSGGPEPVEVVCGAWNFEVGDVVVFAPVGSVLPGGFRIEQRQMRGVVSNGMICSGRELRLSDDHAGIMVLGHLDGARGSEADAGFELGLPLADHLGEGFGPDVVFDLAIEGNRPDCLCVAGVARDLAALLGLPLEMPQPEVEHGPAPAAGFAGVEVLAPELCHRLLAKVVLGVSSAPSPPSVARRLTLAGMRPIDSIVDASNYVMLELGQPTHPYDLDRLGGHGLRVRAAHPGEELVTLDGVTRVLGTRPCKPGDPVSGLDCVICDAEDAPVGIAGIMGGRSSEISGEVARVLLEVGYFVPEAVARTSRHLGLRTEASVRFERGVDRTGMERAALRFSELVVNAARVARVEPPVIADGLVDAEPVAYQPRRITVLPGRIGALLGTKLDGDEVARLLAPLGFEPSGGSTSDELELLIPPYRPDVGAEVDVAEEVARRIGYEELPSTERRSPYVGRLDELQSLRRRLKRILQGLGAHEAWTTSVVDEREQRLAGVDVPLVGLLNPMVAEESSLRGGLLPGLMAAARHNARHRNPWLRLFEVGDVFSLPETTAQAEPPELVDEREMLGVLLAEEGDDAGSAVNAWRVVADALRLEAVMLRSATRPGLHPARTAEIVAGGVVIGVVGEVDPEVVRAHELPHSRVGWFELELARLAAAPRRDLEARPVSRFPSSDIDLAFLVPDAVPAAELQATLGEAAGELCESVVLFDVYRGAGVPAGSRSLAYRLRFVSNDRTLTDGEIAELRTSCIEAAERRHGAKLR